MIIERPSSRSWLPVGATLPAATWDGRHRNLVVLLWGLLGAVVVVLWLVERSSSPRVVALQVMVGALLVSALVATAEHPRLSPPAERSLRSCAVAFGLMVSAAVVVGVLHGASEAHFLFFVLVPLLALYEAWLPSLVAVVVVVLQHGLVGALVPGLVFSGEQNVASDPWLLAATHGVLFAAACAGSLIPWQGAERAREQVAGVVEQLRVQTRSDELTGLANRTGLARGLDLVLCRADDSGPFTPAVWAEDTSPDRQGTSMPVAVVVMDLNRFKEVNDTLGHSAGDQLLRDTAARMSAVVAGVGLLARLGGDEFALVLPGADGQAGTAIAELLRQQLRGGSRVAGIDLDLDLSAGVAVHAGGEALDAADRARVAEELLRHADIAMYVAKAAGGGALEYDPALDHHSTARLEIARDLRIAVERDDELLLHFQPKLSAADGRLVGVEALVRWQHPVRGFLPPGDFVPVLENTDLVNAFTDRVLQLGLDQARAWLDAGYEVPVAVNVSPRCMVRPGFVDAVAQMLASRSLPTHLLRVEITEDALVADPEVAATVITELRAMGVPTSIDDFGTGYSSLSYLRRLPVDEVKLDRAFVTGLGQPLQDGQQLPGAGDEVLVASIIDLAHRLGMKVVAEGVEHDDELAVLRSLGCDVTQGYLHSRPLPASLLPAALLETAALRGSGARTAAPVTAPS